MKYSAILTSIWFWCCCNSSLVFSSSWTLRCNCRCRSWTSPRNLALIRSRFLISSWTSRLLSCSRLTCSASCILHNIISSYILAIKLRKFTPHLLKNTCISYNMKFISEHCYFILHQSFSIVVLLFTAW